MRSTAVAGERKREKERNRQISVPGKEADIPVCAFPFRSPSHCLPGHFLHMHLNSKSCLPAPPPDLCDSLSFAPSDEGLK
ncbi:hypothetical protein F2P79_012277 [Pimephales promelas]|nr:hypothetical protein F2P79_012277 [Pimephales promelas]